MLLVTLLKAEKDTFLNHAYKLKINAPVKDLNVLMCKKTHCKIKKIPDSDLQMLTSKSWLINSSRIGRIVLMLTIIILTSKYLLI